jgi:hypothetical protein
MKRILRRGDDLDLGEETPLGHTIVPSSSARSSENTAGAPLTSPSPIVCREVRCNLRPVSTERSQARWSGRGKPLWSSLLSGRG